MKPYRIALAVPVVLLVAACGAAPSGGDSAASRLAAEPTPAGPAADALGTADLPGTQDAAAAGGSQASTLKTATPGIEGRSVISQGQVSLRTPDIDQARFELVKVLDTFGGAISSENSSGDQHGRAERDRLELRVPAKNFADAMDEIAKLGTLVERTSTSTDVTTQVIDVNTRVRTQRLSLARVQALLDRASTIDEIIRIEGQVARRQADLDSLEQQQKYLADQTALSTITVYLTVPDEKAATSHKTHHTFLTGLDAGWSSLKSLTTNVLAGLGAALPYAAVIAALVLLVRVGRRRRVSAR